jgi:phage regulator Rha-like protein
MKVQVIQDCIYESRGERVMLDFDLANLYGVETRVFNQAIKRNIQSFPRDFMFRLTAKEWKEISSSQIVMMENIPKNRTSKYLPYAFTEHGVTMLASILKSPKARKMNIAIVRAFIALKRFANKNAAIMHLVKELKDRIDEHDVQLSSIYDAIENMLDEKEEEKGIKISWEERERIGFKK